MKKKFSAFLLASSSMILSANLFATPLQQFNIVNLLSNQDATNGAVGQSPTAVLISFYVSGAQSPCYTTTLAYQNSVSVSTGTGFACTTAVTSITFAPVAAPIIGAVYSAPSAFTPTVGQYYTQLAISQPTANPTSYGPVFNTTNGVVTTPGTVVINAQ